MNNMNNVCSVLYSSDNNFVEILGISILSLVKNNTFHELNIYIVDGGISEENRKKIDNIVSDNDNISIIWIVNFKIEEWVGSELRTDRGSLSQYSRLFISSFLPKDLDRILYLDCDILINKPIDSLWSFDLEGNIVAALLDPFSKQYRRNLLLSDDDIYFNSGVMLIDLHMWRESGIQDKLVDFIQKFDGKLPQGDQGVLNGVLSKTTKLLPPIYNTITLFFDLTYEEMMIYRKTPFYYTKDEVEQAKLNPVIVHFTTSFLSKRPWYYGSAHPYTKQWINYKEISSWKDKELRSENLKLYKKLYRSFFNVIPRKVSIYISGILQAYIRPLYEKFQYRSH